eukprot:4511388-Prymnesium_polylepis.3
MAPPLVVEDKGVSEGILATGNALQSAAQRALGRRGIEVWPVEVFVAQGALGRPLIRVQARRAATSATHSVHQFPAASTQRLESYCAYHGRHSVAPDFG